jgi:hypothetical protein
MSKHSLLAAVCLLVGCYRATSKPSPPIASNYEYEYEQGGPTHNAKWWLCTAEGKMGTASSDGAWSYSTERGHGDGSTRFVAYSKAVDSCNSVMTMSLLLARRNEKRDAGTCEVTDCVGPGQ